MYNALIVDDEMPSLQFLQAIIKKHGPDFSISEKFQEGIGALEWLKSHNDIDLLITDINLPDLNGIILAKEARKMYPGIHIIVVSGYAEFEYAKGAIEAAVDDYVLKPVSISHMAELLKKTKERLDKDREIRLSDSLTRLMNGDEYDRAYIIRTFGETKYHFALTRFGNFSRTENELKNTSLMNTDSFWLQFLSGRDEDELLIFASAERPATEFQSMVKSFALQKKVPTSTIVFARSAQPFTFLRDFYKKGSEILRDSIILGHNHFVFFSDSTGTFEDPHIPGAVIKRLELFVTDNDKRMIRNVFLSLAADWDNHHITQKQSYIMIQQLIYMVQTLRLNQTKSTEMIMFETDNLMKEAVTYNDLMERLFTILFDDDSISGRFMSPKDMYNFAIASIKEKFAQPLNIQTICSEIGISQTYLSRLFRKYGDTTFNTELISCRMDNAMSLIDNHPDMPMHQVAACVGYTDYAYFSKVFRQVVGCTPSQYASDRHGTHEE